MLRFSGAGVSEVGLVLARQRGLRLRRSPTSSWWPMGSAARPRARSPPRPRPTPPAVMALARVGPPPEPLLAGAFRRRPAGVRQGVQRRPRPARHGHDPHRLSSPTAPMFVLGPRRRPPAYLLRDGGCARSPATTPTSSTWSTPVSSTRGARGHPWSNVVMRSLDGDPVEARRHRLSVREGDRLLLCSDGLTDLVRDERIAEVLRLRTRTPRLPSWPSPRCSRAARTTSPRGPRRRRGSAGLGDGRLLGALRDVATSSTRPRARATTR